MTHFHQPTLFDDDDETQAPAINIAAFEAATEHPLDEHSRITHVPGFLTGHHQFVDQLAALDIWEQRQRWMSDRLVDEPRLTGEYVDLSAAPALLAELGATLTERLGVRYDRIWMNWYRDHHDGTGWHADRPAH